MDFLVDSLPFTSVEISNEFVAKGIWQNITKIEFQLITHTLALPGDKCKINSL